MGRHLSADDIGLVNCAGCGRELLGENTRRRLDNGEVWTDADLPPVVAGRWRGRPYCADCWPEARASAWEDT